MFDKLIDILLNFWNNLTFWYICDQWEEGILLRAGRYQKTFGPGIWLKIPLIDAVWKTIVITQSIDLPPQSLTTLDGKNIVVKGIIRFHIVDTKKFLTSISHPNDVLTDTTGGMIRDIVENTDWNDLYDVDVELTKEVGDFVSKWGIGVEKVTLTNLQIANSIRIIQDEHNQKITPLDNTYTQN